MLYLVGVLAGRDAVGVEAVAVPACLDARRRFVTPAADTVYRRLSPPGRAVDEASGMFCGMSSVVQHEAPELPSSDGSAHALPLLLKLPATVRGNHLYEEGL